MKYEVSKVPVQVTHEVFQMEQTEVMVTRWEGPPPLTAEEEAQQGCYTYFLELGCEGSRRGSRPVVRLPNGVDEWSIEVDGDKLVIEKVLRDRYSESRAKPFTVPLSDPESLPKALAHMQKHTKFLRGGLGDYIPKIKAV